MYAFENDSNGQILVVCLCRHKQVIFRTEAIWEFVIYVGKSWRSGLCDLFRNVAARGIYSSIAARARRVCLYRIKGAALVCGRRASRRLE